MNVPTTTVPPFFLVSNTRLSPSDPKICCLSQSGRCTGQVAEEGEGGGGELETEVGGSAASRCSLWPRKRSGARRFQVAHRVSSGSTPHDKSLASSLGWGQLYPRIFIISRMF